MSPFTAEFDEDVRSMLDRWHIPGVAFSVVHNDHSWSKGYGMAIRPSTPMTPSTLQYGASTTKGQLCALWAIYLSSESNQQKGDAKITWKTPLADIIPGDFVLADPHTTRRVTIEDCLSHRTGMSAHDFIYGHETTRTTRDVTRCVRHLPLRTDLREGFEYCNLMYVVASYALEFITGRTLSELFHEWLWGPLGMENTHAAYDEAASAVKTKGSVLAKGYTWTKSPGDPAGDQGFLYEEADLRLTELSGAAYVISTADDFAKWMSCLLHGTKPLQSAVEDLLSPRVIVPSEEAIPGDGPIDGFMTYSLGWFSGTYHGKRIFWNPGLLNGRGSLILLAPDLIWGVAFLGNGDNAGAKLKGLSYLLLDHVIDTPNNESGFDKSNALVQSAYTQAFENFNPSISALYPSAHKTEHIPLGCDIEHYTGTYTHPAYGPITWKLRKDDKGPYLRMDLDRWLPYIFTMRHINAEYWIGISYKMEWIQPEIFKAQSRMGVDGRPEAIGFATESCMPDTLFWFTRI